MFCKFSLPFREDCFIIIMLNYSCTPAGTGRTAWKGDRDDLQRPFFQAFDSVGAPFDDRGSHMLCLFLLAENWESGAAAGRAGRGYPALPGDAAI